MFNFFTHFTYMASRPTEHMLQNHSQAPASLVSVSHISCFFPFHSRSRIRQTVVNHLVSVWVHYNCFVHLKSQVLYQWQLESASLVACASQSEPGKIESGMTMVRDWREVFDNSKLFTGLSVNPTETRKESYLTLLRVPQVIVVCIILVVCSQSQGFVEPTLEPHMRQVYFTYWSLCHMLFLLHVDNIGALYACWGYLAYTCACTIKWNHVIISKRLPELTPSHRGLRGKMHPKRQLYHS